MSDPVQAAEVAVKSEAKSVFERIVAFVRANTFKAISGSAIVGAVVGRFYL